MCHLLHEEFDQSYSATLFAGWGLANEDVLGGWYYSDVLREAKVANLHSLHAVERNIYLSQVPIITKADCMKNMEENGLGFIEGVLCAGGNTNGTCQV